MLFQERVNRPPHFCCRFSLQSLSSFFRLTDSAPVKEQETCEENAGSRKKSKQDAEKKTADKTKTMATDGAAARALDLVKKADKRLTSFSLFGGNKYEDAAELLEKAATQYKLAKCCEFSDNFVLFDGDG